VAGGGKCRLKNNEGVRVLGGRACMVGWRWMLMQVASCLDVCMEEKVDRSLLAGTFHHPRQCMVVSKMGSSKVAAGSTRIQPKDIEQVVSVEKGRKLSSHQLSSRLKPTYGPIAQSNGQPLWGSWI
jgi:hypothetical protein